LSFHVRRKSASTEHAERIMLSRRAVPVALAAAAVEVCALRAAHAQPSRELFTLGRSKNANVVKYAVRIGRNGRLDLAEPVEAYWRMLAEDGRREELTWTERRIAYGFSVSAVESAGLMLHLTACSGRELRVREVSGSYRAELSISGQSAFLRRIFVRAEEGLLMPRVLFIEVSGVTRDGHAVRERIAPR
jgi:Domain of unknown function (DUF4833)